MVSNSSDQLHSASHWESGDDLFLSRLEGAIAEASVRYCRLVLLAGFSQAMCSSMLRIAARTCGYPLTFVSQSVAVLLLDVSSRKRPAVVAEIASQVIGSAAQERAILLDHLELLFLPDLRLDPLKLLQDAARNRVIVAAWDGSFEGGVLRYGLPSHSEFREYRNPDAIIVNVDTLARSSP